MTRKSLIIVIISVFAVSCKEIKKDKLGYINTPRVINEFDFKKTLDSELELFFKIQRESLDSLSSKLEVKYESILTLEGKAKETALEEFKALESIYNNKKDFFDKQNNQKVTFCNKRMFDSLNVYVKQFSEENKYTFLYGTTSEGNIMYADTTYDASDAVIEYINNRFELEDKKYK